MKDAVFTAGDVPGAVAAASRSLGVPAEVLRYVVLEAGGGDTSARIAVLLDASATATRERSPGAAHPPAGEAASQVVRELARAAELDVEIALDQSDEAITVRIDGPDGEFFSADEGRVLNALQHVLQRAVSARLERRRVALELPGYRDRRDEQLRDQVQGLARRVLEDGTPRTTDPLNSYQRRIVHLAVAELEGLRTESVGAAGDRRVSILPLAPRSAD